MPVDLDLSVTTPCCVILVPLLVFTLSATSVSGATTPSRVIFAPKEVSRLTVAVVEGAVAEVAAGVVVTTFLVPEERSIVSNPLFVDACAARTAAVFDALRRTEAYSLNGTSGNELTLRFTKEAGSTDELLEMKFEDYMVTTADFPLTNDNGPISVTWEIQPLKLKSCSHITNWVIQG